MEVGDLMKKTVWENLNGILMYFKHFLKGYVLGFLICMLLSTIFNSVCNKLGASLDFSKDGILLFLTSVRNLSVFIAVILFTCQMCSLVWQDTCYRQGSYVSGFFNIMLEYLGFFISLEGFIRLFDETFKGTYGRSDLSVFIDGEFKRNIVFLGVIIILLEIIRKVCERKDVKEVGRWKQNM